MLLRILTVLIILFIAGCALFTCFIFVRSGRQLARAEAAYHKAVRKEAYRRYIKEMKARNRPVDRPPDHRWYPPF
ncbi:TPA: hypothetical protein UZ440_004357 [Escherichia coli]|nr:hypothetical protein [Escherichia coli]HEM0087436.1 hypothetical protein [Escherichia coli]HEM0854205.1 hypothetical protein [Escherichia coli]